MSASLAPASTYASVFASSTPASTPRSKVFRGFSSINADRTGESTLFDIALINRDLLNHFNTRIGERVMRPEWGCLLWDFHFESLTSLLRDQIIAEVVRICEADSRLAVLDTQVFDYQNGIRVEMTLDYRPFNVVNSFTLDFENRQGVLVNSSVT